MSVPEYSFVVKEYISNPFFFHRSDTHNFFQDTGKATVELLTTFGTES